MVVFTTALSTDTIITSISTSPKLPHPALFCNVFAVVYMKRDEFLLWITQIKPNNCMYPGAEGGSWLTQADRVEHITIWSLAKGCSNYQNIKTSFFDSSREEDNKLCVMRHLYLYWKICIIFIVKYSLGVKRSICIIIFFIFLLRPVDTGLT